MEGAIFAFGIDGELEIGNSRLSVLGADNDKQRGLQHRYNNHNDEKNTNIQEFLSFDDFELASVFKCGHSLRGCPSVCYFYLSNIQIIAFGASWHSFTENSPEIHEKTRTYFPWNTGLFNRDPYNGLL